MDGWLILFFLIFAFGFPVKLILGGYRALHGRKRSLPGKRSSPQALKGPKFAKNERQSLQPSRAYLKEAFARASSSDALFVKEEAVATCALEKEKEPLVHGSMDWKRAIVLNEVLGSPKGLSSYFSSSRFSQTDKSGS